MKTYREFGAVAATCIDLSWEIKAQGLSSTAFCFVISTQCRDE